MPGDAPTPSTFGLETKCRKISGGKGNDSSIPFPPSPGSPPRPRCLSLSFSAPCVCTVDPQNDGIYIYIKIAAGMAAAVNINKNGKPTIMAGGKYDAYLYPSPLSACFKLIFPKCQPPQNTHTLPPFFNPCSVFLFSLFQNNPRNIELVARTSTIIN